MSGSRRSTRASHGTARRPSSGGRGGAAPAADPQRFAAQDEPFWQAQEARLAEQLGQPCCTLSGMCTLLGNLRGGLAVIVHGEADCAGSFVYHRMAAAHRFFVTGVTEEQATTGQVDAPLASCLRLVLAEPDVEAVLVLGTCLITMIGADPQAVVDRVLRETGTSVPVRYLATGGLRLGSQWEMADWLYSVLAQLPQLSNDPRRSARARSSPMAAFGPSGPDPGPERQRAARAAAVPMATQGPAPTEPAGAGQRNGPIRVGLLGLRPEDVLHSELPEVFGRAGLELGGIYPDVGHLDDWRRLCTLDVMAVADERLYPRLLQVLQGRHGVSTVQVPLPVGLGQSRAFYRRIGEHVGQWDALRDAVAAAAAPAEAALADFRRRASGLRLALGIRMLNNYQADQLAYDGLGDAEAFAEAGFETTLLIQGPPEAADRFSEMLDQLGYRLPFRVFPSPWTLAPLLAEGRYDVAYLADHAREEARKLGLPMLESRTLRPLLRGVAPNLARLEALLRAARPGAV